MANVIKLRRSAVQGNVPTTAQIALGEVAINTYDGKIYLKKDDGTEQVLDPGYNGAIVSDTTPAVRPDGSPLLNGDQWWKSNTGNFYVYFASAWVHVGGSSNVEEAPLDGNYYVRQSGSWVDMRFALNELGVIADTTWNGGDFDTGAGSDTDFVISGGTA